MEKPNKQIVIDLYLQQGPDNGSEPLAGSGFEEEQPEPDFDERI